MTRAAFTLLTLALVSLWADAQTAPPPVVAGDRVRLLRANRSLLEDLIDRGVKLSDAPGKLDRAEECRRTLGALTDALNRATEEPAADADRVAELTDHLTELVQSGLVPTLAEVRGQVATASPDGRRLASIEEAVATDLSAVRQQFLLDPRFARSAKLQDCQERLRLAARKVQPKE